MAKATFNMSDADLRKWVYSEFMLRAPKAVRVRNQEGPIQWYDYSPEELLLQMNNVFNWIKDGADG